MTPGSTRKSGAGHPNGAPAEIPTLREAFGYFGRLLMLIRAYWTPLIQGMAVGLVLGIVGMATPYLSKLLIDEVYPTGNITLMHVLVGGVLAISIATTVMSSIRGYFTQFVGAKLSSATTLMFFNHLQHLPMRFFDEHRVGEVMSRFQDVRTSLGTVSQVMETVLVRGVYLVLVPPMLFLLSWKLAIVSLLTIPVTGAIGVATARVLRKYWKKSAEAYADLNAYQVEVLSNIRTLKAFALEAHVFHKTRDQVEGALGHQLTAGGVGTLIGVVNGAVRAMGTALTTWLAWTLIIRQEMTLGSYIAFTAYVGYLTGPVTQIVSLFASFQQAAVTLGRMFEYLDEVPEQDPVDSHEAIPLVVTALSGAIRLEKVSFSYSPGVPVLERLDLRFEKGEVTAIVGPSGAGKSTLLRLLNRIDEPDEGRILFDEEPAQSIALRDLRRQIAVVWQDVQLVRGTVWDNLVLGIDPPPREAVESVVRVCQLDTFIRGLPDGFDSPIAEWGASLSGGQRQRMAIARAVLRDAPILLLDEPTSNLDVETEVDLLRGLLGALRGRTVIFTTHRITNTEFADRVLMLEAGRLAGDGTHQELLERSEGFRRMRAAAMAGDEARRLRVIGTTPTP